MKRFPIFLLSVLLSCFAAANKDRPNILYLYVDDMGWGAIGPNAQAERAARGLPRTLMPNLDKLAAEGVNFSRSYGCTVCSPARSSQQTGFHQGHTFGDRNDPDNAKKALRTDDVLIGDVLSAAGYATGYWGKWGYGGGKEQVDPTLDNVQSLPSMHGYQHVVAELHHVRAHTFFQPTLWNAPAAPGALGGLELKPNSMAKYIGNPKYPNEPALQNHPDYPKTAYCDDVYAFAALDFVRRQAQRYNETGQPFFGLLAVQIPHAPFAEIEALPEWDRALKKDPRFASLSEQTRHWVAMVSRIDGHFGNILAALEDPNGDGDSSDSVADNTLVVFTSDNGGPSNPVLDDLNINGGLRGQKGTIYEGGIRIPTIMRWPAQITRNSALKAGTSTDRVIDVSDMLPTFCDLAGVGAPLGIDGVSLAPTLRGSGYQRPREFIIHEAGKQHSIIRGQHKLVRSISGERELYDLKADHAEEKNLASAHPALVKELEAILLAERVTEPEGFANTYHRWTGEDGASTSEADNWSDYVYANAGITYMSDAGAPQLSWVALMENTGNRDALARVDADLEFLGLEIRGNASARQTLELPSSRKLTGRNEVRVASGGALNLLGGSVSSMRWVDLQSGGILRGAGNIQASLLNAGVLSIRAFPREKDQTLVVHGDYREDSEALLRLPLLQEKELRLDVKGAAVLAGSLVISLAPDFKPAPGSSITILKARSIQGSFANPGQEVVARDGERFKIGYNDTSVTLTLVP